MTVIFKPTGTCFDDVSSFIAGQLVHEDDLTHFIHHGMCVMKDGSQYSHAWCLKGETVIDLAKKRDETVILEMPLDVFLRGRKCKYYIEYTTTEYIAANGLASKNAPNAGPYTKELYEECGDFKEHQMPDHIYRILGLFGRKVEVRG